MSSAAGGVFVMKENDRPSKIVISTGKIVPRMASNAALYCLQNYMMLTTCGPTAVPTGGRGVAAPGLSATLTRAATFFLAGMVFGSLLVVRWPGHPRPWCGRFRPAHYDDFWTF